MGLEGRRSYSVPEGPSQDYRKYVPSEEMGDYEQLRRRKERKSSAPLYPLSEECTYGAPPSALPKPLPPYQRRERKAKVYASYAVDSECSAHGDVLTRNESNRGLSPPKTVRRRASTPTQQRPASATPRLERKNSVRSYRGPSPVASLERKGSIRSYRGPSPVTSLERRGSMRSYRGPSPAPPIDSYSGRPKDWQNSLRGLQPSTPRVQRRPARRESKSPDRPISHQSLSPPRSFYQQDIGRSSSSDIVPNSAPPTNWGYTSFDEFTARRSSEKSSSTLDRRAYSSLNRKDHKRSPSPVKVLSPERKEQQSASSPSKSFESKLGKSSYKSYQDTYDIEKPSYAKYQDSPRQGKIGSISLKGLKLPVINMWDSMGVLGLSSKMFSETANKQTFSASSLVRKQSVTTHAM